MTVRAPDDRSGERTGTGSADVLAPGSELDSGRYRLGPVLGRGGFGITYQADDLRLRRSVAIKELFPDHARRSGRSVVVPGDAADGFARARQRFLREATTLARFGHPGIVRIFAVFEEHGTAYIVLEQLDGLTLSQEMRRRQGPLSEAEALDVAGQVAAALSVVHWAGVLHRDVSPANLVRTSDGRIVLIDFGLARADAFDHTTAMTRIVTPGYAPPEQYRGQARFSARADVYSLGATLYRLLSGQAPPDAAARGRGAGLAPLWRVNPTVSRVVSDAVDVALALDPEERPASGAALLERLGVSTEGLDLVPPVPTPIDGLDDGVTAFVNGALRDEPSTDAPPRLEPGDIGQGGGRDPGAGVGGRETEPPPDLVEAPTGLDGADIEGRTQAGAADSETPQQSDRRPPSGDVDSARPGATDGLGTEAWRPEQSDLSRGTEAWRPEQPDPSDRSITWRPHQTEPAPGPRPLGAGPGPESRPRHVVPAPVVPEPGRVDTSPLPGSHPRQAPRAHGAPPRRRAWLTWPLALAAMALASAQPATVTLLVGLGVAPVLATAGDRILRPHRRAGWVVGWWLRNLLVGLVRSLGGLVVLALGLCLWFGSEAFDSVASAGPWVLRATGLAAAGVLCLSVGRGGAGFRSHVALDALTVRLMPRGQLTTPAAVVVVTCIAVAAAGLWFSPEAWPLGA